MAETAALNQAQEIDSQLLTYRFNVSQNEEHVYLRVVLDNKEIDLGERVHHYVMLELARKRITDAESGISESERGWISRKDFANMLGLNDTLNLNMQIYRFRKQLHKATPENTCVSNMVESRRNEIRFVAEKVEISGGLPSST